jgi:hypothetical protein
MLGSSFAQVAKRRPSDKGPRAVALLQLAANGKAHLVPITIMINGRFYDAGAYKADPIPMALQPETVYEVEKTGVSQGIFTVAGAFHIKNQGWAADGKWRTNAAIEAEKTRAKADRERRDQKAPADQELGGPPRLKRGQEAPPQGPADKPSSQPGSNSTPTSTPSSASTSSKPGSPTPSSSQKPSGSSSPQTSSTGSEIDDPNRPTLRHQAPSETTHEQTKAGNENEPLQGPLQFIPAVSDADGPEPRPYTYQLKADEEQTLLKKMQAMAVDEIRARASHAGQESASPKPPTSAKKAKAAPSPEFHDTHMRVFDLTTSNEPVLVLTTQAKISTAPDLDFIIALVARQDIYGDLHKVFAQTTDDKHLDVLPRYEFIDAVDADGDGVGELLFKTTSDSGSAFAVYRVIGDQLWPLFEGKPGT